MKTRNLEAIAPLHSVNKLADLLSVPPEVLWDLADQVPRLYRPFILRTGIRNREGRNIDNPREFLKYIQKRIDVRLLRAVPLPSYIHGGIPGHSVRDNAIPHVGKRLVVGLDIRKCFPSIRAQHVAQSLRCHLATGCDVTWLMTRLLTFEGHIPQGAPSSTTLANIVLAPVMKSILAKQAASELTLSTWLDDIIFSGGDAKTVINLIAKALSQMGLPLSRKKTRLMPSSQRQIVTGTIVNRKVSVGKERKRRVRSEVRATRGAPLDHKLRGHLGHIKSVCPPQAAALARLGLVVKKTVKSNTDSALVSLPRLDIPDEIGALDAKCAELQGRIRGLV